MNREELVVLHAAIATVLAWPPAVFDQVARWLAPDAAKANGADPHRGNGLDPHPTPIAPNPVQTLGPAKAPTPPAVLPHVGANARAKSHRRALPTAADARAAERKVLAALRQTPGASVNALAAAVGAGRSTTGERLRRLARSGAIEKDGEGRWRLAGEEPRPPSARSL